jgi:hypothetical protein
MWAWWFGWHGCDTRRYKLWHPRAHLSAAWKDGERDGDGTGRQGARRYVGRWSLIREYIGSTMVSGAIQFVAPSAMGLPPDSDDAVAICARLGSGDAPVDAGWFIHHIRSTRGGAEVRPIASRILGTSEATARNLLVHCAQEMNHLTGFLPDLYESFGDE